MTEQDPRAGRERPSTTKRSIWESLMEETTPDRPSICDYEGSNYRTEFWEGQGRDYEDRVERVALKKLLPERGNALLEIGAGFGRLTNEYIDRYDKIVLLDYSFSQLEYAREHLGASDKFMYVAADAYHLPFHSARFDGVTMIRTIHHMKNVNSALHEVARVIAPNGIFILEHANKRNLKAMARYALRRQSWSPYDHHPHEFVELNFVFHPRYIVEMLAVNGFAIQRRIPVSFFRMGVLKRVFPLNWLVKADDLLQNTMAYISPSIFIKAVRSPSHPYSKTIPPTGKLAEYDTYEPLLACPRTRGPLVREGNELISVRTGLRYAIRDGIYDFKVPLNES